MHLQKPDESFRRQKQPASSVFYKARYSHFKFQSHEHWRKKKAEKQKKSASSIQLFICYTNDFNTKQTTNSIRRLVHSFSNAPNSQQQSLFIRKNSIAKPSFSLFFPLFFPQIFRDFRQNPAKCFRATRRTTNSHLSEEPLWYKCTSERIFWKSKMKERKKPGGCASNQKDTYEVSKYKLQ